MQVRVHRFWSRSEPIHLSQDQSSKSRRIAVLIFCQEILAPERSEVSGRLSLSGCVPCRTKLSSRRFDCKRRDCVVPSVAAVNEFAGRMHQYFGCREVISLCIGWKGRYAFDHCQLALRRIPTGHRKCHVEFVDDVQKFSIRGKAQVSRSGARAVLANGCSDGTSFLLGSIDL